MKILHLPRLCALILCFMLVFSLSLPTVSAATVSDPPTTSDDASLSDPAPNGTSAEDPLDDIDDPVDSSLDTDPGLNTDPDLTVDQPYTSSTVYDAPSFGATITDADGTIMSGNRELQPGHIYTFHVQFYNTGTTPLHGAAVSLRNINNATTFSDTHCAWYEVRLIANNLSTYSNSKTSNYGTCKIQFYAATGLQHVPYAYVPGSAKLTTAAQPDGVAISDIELFSDTGALIGYSAIDGNLPGGRNFVCTLTFQVRIGDTSADNPNESSDPTAPDTTDDPTASIAPDATDSPNSAPGSDSPSNTPPEATTNFGISTLHVLLQIITFAVLGVIAYELWLIYRFITTHAHTNDPDRPISSNSGDNNLTKEDEPQDL